MPNIKLPDGSVRQFDGAVSGLEIAARIGKGLARDAIAIRVNGALWDLTREIEDLFVSMGYQIADGPEIETDFHNFQALNIPPDHPARTMKDSLYVAIPGHPELLLRTETSAASQIDPAVRANPSDV